MYYVSYEYEKTTETPEQIKEAWSLAAEFKVVSPDTAC
jgi:hypothetical protein